MKTGINAQKLRFVLVGLLLILIAAGVGAFIFSYSLLNNYTAETSALDAQARLSDTNVANLKKIKEYLADNSLEVQRAKDIVAESRKYQYQDDIVRDISSYANQSGVQITSYTFTNEGGAAASSPAAAPTGGNASSSPGASAAVSGVKTTTASIVIKSPVGYTNLLNFIRRIERSPMKMQISSVSLSKADGNDQNLVSTQSFLIEVYIR